MPPRSDDNRTRKKRNSHGLAARCKTGAKGCASCAAEAAPTTKWLSQRVVRRSDKPSSTFPLLAAVQPCAPKQWLMLVCHLLVITKRKRPLLLATTAAHQRLAEDSVVHQSIRRLEICGDGLRLRSTRGLFYLICAIRDAYRSKKDTSGDDTPARPPAGPAALASCPQRASGWTRPSLPGGST